MNDNVYINCRDGPNVDTYHIESHSRVPRSEMKANKKATEDTVQTLKDSPLALKISLQKVEIILQSA